MKKITINAIKTYDVLIDENLLSRFNLDITRDYVIITDTGVPQQWVNRVKAQLSNPLVLTVEAGEQSKSLSVYQHLVAELQAHAIDKSACLIALGGGMVGDLTGFLACTYLRGIDWINIPTTLLAMVDASIGGKVALNTSVSKNVIGGFYPPLSVIIDPLVLSTLPKKEMGNGYAEMIKIACIKDADFLNVLEKKLGSLDTQIAHAITLKKCFVEHDPYDQNIRKHLNFGHTIGHALEQLHQYRYSHGQCVAYGMRIMVHKTAFETRVGAVLNTYNLNDIITYDKDQLIKQVMFDKKKQKTTIELIELSDIGHAIIHTIDASELHHYIPEKGVLL